MQRIPEGRRGVPAAAGRIKGASRGVQALWQAGEGQAAARFVLDDKGVVMPGKRDVPIHIRLLSKSRMEGCCLVWTASVTTSGYGQLNVDGKPAYAHRLAWELAFGEIPSGLFVCHTCDNPLCINPAHLFLGTAEDNASDMVNKDRSAFGEKHWKVKLTSAQVRDIRRKYAGGGITQRELGEEYGVSDSHICRIVGGRFWRKYNDAM